MKNLSTPHDVLMTYALAYDTGDVDTLAECFAQDGEFSFAIEGGASGGPMVGRDAIRESNRATIESQRGTGTRRHLVSNVIVEVEGSSARVVSYLTLTVAVDGELRVVTTGVYDDAMAWDGAAWRITRRHLHLDLPF